MIKKYQNMFKEANIENLRNARIISKSSESLEEYTDTIYEYVEPYANYYKAAQKTGTCILSGMFLLYITLNDDMPAMHYRWLRNDSQERCQTKLWFLRHTQWVLASELK